MSLHKLASILVALTGITNLWAQCPDGAKLEGKITDEKGNPIAYVHISIQQTSFGAISAEDGSFTIPCIPSGHYQLLASNMGYFPYSNTLTLQKGETQYVRIKLKENPKTLNEVEISGNSLVQDVKEKAFTVSSIDVKPLHNLNLDVNAVLNRSTGIRIRQDGGMGSDFSFSLNGFSGNQVRFFLDGIPMNYMGGSLSLNNIPVNLVDRIEVYKGVVPVYLGSDALGGAVNVITTNKNIDFVDASYSYGSFNTHQAAVSSRTSIKRHFVINASAFYNYSDNNYTIDASLIDKNTGKIGTPQPIKRFNDAYRSNALLFEAGIVDKWYADRLLIGVIGSGYRKEIQQGANMTKVAGEVYRTNETITPTLKYQKRNLFVDGLSVSLASLYSYEQTMSVDTSSKIYDWDGSYSYKKFGVTSGELNWDKTLFRFNDHATLTTTTLEYALGQKHLFTFSNMYSWFQRQGEDPISYNAIPFNDPNVLIKNTSGLSYKLSLFNNRWNTTVFTKSFYMKAKVYEENVVTDDFDANENTSTHFGAGIASSVALNKNLLIKLSYESTYRLPESYELFGDGLLLLPNPTLTPEKSSNYNIGLLYKGRWGKHRLNAEGGFVYRLPEDMIRIVPIAITSHYENLTSATVTGWEAMWSYDYNHWFNIELNGTYQNILNTNRVKNNLPDPLYLDRLPNIPFLFGNGIVGAQTSEFGKRHSKIGFNWSSLFVEAFYLKWPSQGYRATKFDIPRQISHDASVSFTTYSGRYNISLTCQNVADAKRYDNFGIQKPGRSFNIKFRYYLTFKS